MQSAKWDVAKLVTGAVLFSGSLATGGLCLASGAWVAGLSWYGVAFTLWAVTN